MSFSALKKSSQASIQALTEKLSQEKSGGFTQDERFWQPEVDKTGNGYAVIRFLPAPEGHDTPYVKIYNHGFKIGSRWYIENCPTTIGGTCPVCEHNGELWNTGDKENQATVRGRSRKTQYISNVLVISDAKHPENEGKVFLFRFGKKIFEKITQSIQPEFEDEKPVNPFDFWSGANFKLKIRNFEGFRNYDKSEFEDTSPLLDGDDDALEALWKSEHPLLPLIAESEFKSYDVLKEKFLKITGGASADSTDASTKHLESDGKDAARTPRVNKSEASSSVDDDLAAYSSLIND